MSLNPLWCRFSSSLPTTSTTYIAPLNCNYTATPPLPTRIDASRESVSLFGDENGTGTGSWRVWPGSAPGELNVCRWPRAEPRRPLRTCRSKSGEPTHCRTTSGAASQSSGCPPVRAHGDHDCQHTRWDSPHHHLALKLRHSRSTRRTGVAPIPDTASGPAPRAHAPALGEVKDCQIQ